MRKFLVACAGVGAMLGGNLSCGGNPVEAQQGPQGPAGKDGVSGYQVVTAFATVLPGGTTPETVSCPAGKVPLSGGYDVENPTVLIVDSYRAAATTDWTFHIRNNSGASALVTLSATCIIAL